jgi:hypothetical protein
MLVPLAIAALGVAVAGDDASSIESIETRFRLMYAMGDRIEAYRFLFEQIGEQQVGERELRKVWITLEGGLRPVLGSLTDRLQEQTTLEGVKAILEEIEEVLVGWEEWSAPQDEDMHLTFSDIVAPSVATGPYPPYQKHKIRKLRWIGEDETGDDPVRPLVTAQIPTFDHLHNVSVRHSLRSNYFPLEMHSAKPCPRKLLACDRADRVLVRWTEGSSHGFMEHFAILPTGSYLAADF